MQQVFIFSSHVRDGGTMNLVHSDAMGVSGLNLEFNIHEWSWKDRREIFNILIMEVINKKWEMTVRLLKTTLLLPFAQTIGKNVSEDQDVWKSGSDPLLVGKEALMEVIRSPPNNTPLCCQPNNRQKNKTKTNKQTILFHFDEYFFCCTNPVKALSMNVLTLYYLCSFVLLYLWLGVYFLTLEPTHSSPMPLASDIDTEKKTAICSPIPGDMHVQICTFAVNFCLLAALKYPRKLSIIFKGLCK